MQEKLLKKAPFNQYGNVSGLKLAWGSPSDPSTYPQDSFDVVYDNNGKDMDSCKPVIDTFKVSGHETDRVRWSQRACRSSCRGCAHPSS